MKVERPRGAELTYCTNIHPGESWAEVEQAIETHVAAVKARVRPDAPFGVGLRLSARAARELEEPGRLDAARELLERLGLYVFTLNGFPYGAFHGTRVKEAVYSPDWLEPERVLYTASLARVLAGLLPEGARGSISTVPGCFRSRAGSGAELAIATNVAHSAAELVALERATGRSVSLALEPEPGCLLETSGDALAFFERALLSPEVLADFSGRVGLAAARAETELRSRVGVCLDACHASVEFEEPRHALERLQRAGIAVPKIQLSAALRLVSPGRRELESLRDFDDGVYLHQTVVRSSDGTLSHFLDLPEALRGVDPRAGDEWRVHFHVPIFATELGTLGSTSAELSALLTGAGELAPHLEVETYSFGVLPPEHRDLPIADAVARELRWAEEQLAARA